MNVPVVPKPAVPALFDIVIGQVQDILKSKLAWLDHSFGRSQLLIREKGKKNFRYPAVHIKKNRYQGLFPDEGLGNFSFFILHDPQEFGADPHTVNLLKSDFSLVFWVNLDKIYGKIDDRNTENLKAEILKVLTREMFLTSGRLTVTSVSEQAENVYSGYDIKELDTQFLMQPFAGFRFEGTLLMLEPC